MCPQTNFELFLRNIAVTVSGENYKSILQIVSCLKGQPRDAQVITVFQAISLSIQKIGKELFASLGPTGLSLFVKKTS